MSISNKNKRITVTLKEELVEILKDYAEKDERTLSNYVSVILQDYVINKKQKIKLESES